MKEIGKYLMLGGLIIFIAGIIIYFSGNKLKWVGRLPGDIRIEKPGFRFYAPVVTMLLISAAISFIIWIIQRFLK